VLFVPTGDFDDMVGFNHEVHVDGDDVDADVMYTGFVDAVDRLDDDVKWLLLLILVLADDVAEFVINSVRSLSKASMA
jgi:hypothetical protein